MEHVRKMSSHTSINTVKTLNGMFDVPKMNHRRDFLRENKLNLRELQRTTMKKNSQAPPDRMIKNQHRSIQQQQQQQKKQQPPLPPAMGRRRSSSLVRIGGDSQSQAQNPNRPTATPPCNSCLQGGRAPKPSVSVHKQIQTEDIQDEEFLYDALRKCASQELRSSLNLDDDRARGEPHMPLATDRYYGAEMGGENVAGDREAYQHSQRLAYADDDEEEEMDRPRAAAELGSHMATQRQNGYAYHDDDDVDDLQQKMSQMKMQPEQLLSARSRHTLRSMQSVRSNDTLVSKRRSNGNLHQLGSRDEVRLPRYLEREKRQKEENRLRELDRDPNCPIDHIMLSEDQRLAALKAAEKKFKLLISELNHMPMTTETLRIRARKNEIEKELVLIEADIRVFSKPKCYIKQPD